MSVYLKDEIDFWCAVYLACITKQNEDLLVSDDDETESFHQVADVALAHYVKRFRGAQ